jgi:hypothetical protein
MRVGIVTDASYMGVAINSGKSGVGACVFLNSINIDSITTRVPGKRYMIPCVGPKLVDFERFRIAVAKARV